MPGLDKSLKFTKISNRLIDDYLPILTSSETVLIVLIARKTWGFQKRKDVISYSQFHKGTGLAKNTIRDALDGLINKRLIKQKPSGKSYEYEINQSVLKKDELENVSKYEGSNSEPAKSTTDAISKFAQMSDQLLTTLKSTNKEKEEINTTNSSRVNLNSIVQKVINAWNERFDEPFNVSNTELINGVKEALAHFSVDQIITAMDNRLQSSYYKYEKPYLLHSPISFFGYLSTIRNDLHRKPENIYTYNQKVALITEQNYNDANFEIRKDLKDEKGKPKWEYRGPNR